MFRQRLFPLLALLLFFGLLPEGRADKSSDRIEPGKIIRVEKEKKFFILSVGGKERYVREDEVRIFKRVPEEQQIPLDKKLEGMGVDVYLIRSGPNFSIGKIVCLPPSKK